MNILDQKIDKEKTPGYGIVGSPSVNTVYASEERSIDGGRKVKGGKRHLVVNTMGNLIRVIVCVANIHEMKSGCDVLKAAARTYSSLAAFSGDAGYRVSRQCG